jgi:hypothetical protein
MIQAIILNLLTYISYTPNLPEESVIKFQVVPVVIILPAQLNFQQVQPIPMQPKLDLRWKPLQLQ